MRYGVQGSWGPGFKTKPICNGIAGNHKVWTPGEFEGKTALKGEVLGRARRVAEVAGGFLGLGNKVSLEEQKILEVLSKAFER